MIASANPALHAGTFRTLVTALQVANLAGTLDTAGPYTVFAPTDAAFARMPQQALRAIMADETKLADVLRCHVVPSRLSSADLESASAATTPTAMNGRRLAIETRDGELFINGARVVQADVQGTNGVIHVVDAVVIPG